MKISNLIAGFSLLVATFVFTFSANSQTYLSITQSNPSSNQLQACQAADTFTLTIKNISAVGISNVDVLPTSSNAGVVYGGFVSVNSGTVSVTSTLPMRFNLPLIAAGQTLVLKYTAKANCASMSGIVGNTAINYADAAFDVAGVGRRTESLTSATSYNLLYPRLDIVSIVPTGFQSDLDNAKIGEFSRFGTSTINNATRGITVQNNGLGVADTVVITMTVEPEIYMNGFNSINTPTTFIPATYISSNVVEIKLFGATLQAFKSDVDFNDNLLHQTEILTLIEDFDVVACGANGQLSQYTVGIICENLACTVPGNSFDDGNVGVVSGTPTIKITVGNKSNVASYCNDEGVLEFDFTNTASDFGDYAANTLLDIISYSKLTPDGFTLYDFAINGQNLLANGATVTAVPLIQWHGFPTTNKHPGYRIDLSGNTNPAIALDWDNDGQLDDLGAGMTYTLTAKVKFDGVQPFENQCPIDYYSLFGLPQIQYQGSCNTTDYKINAAGQPAPLNYQYYSAAINTNGGFNGFITGTNDMVEGVVEVFEFCTGSYQTDMDFFKCPVDSFYAEIILPEGYGLVGTSGIFTSDFSGIETLTASSDGDTITIFGGGHSTLGGITRWTGCYSVPLVMDCALSGTGTITSTSVLSWRMNYICDTCDIVQHRVCDDFTVYNHASCTVGGDCPGIVTTGFNADRTSFGYTDESMTTKVTALSLGVDLNAAYPYDTVQTTTQGLVNSLDIDKLFCQIKAGAPDAPFSWLNGVLSMKNASGISLPDCPITTPPTLSGNATSGYFYVFEIPFSCYGSAGAGFTVNLINNWQVNNSSAIFDNAKETIIKPFRSGFYGTRNDTVFACDEWGTDFKLYSVNTYPWVQSQGGVGCQDLNIKLWMTNSGGKRGNDFPNEYRPVIQIDERITFHIPTGYEYIGNAFTIAITGVSAAGTPIDVLIPITPTFIDADSVVFEYPWALIDKYNSQSTSDSIFPIFKFSLKPDCDRADTMKTILEYGFNRYFYTGNPTYYVHENETYDPNLKGSIYNVTHVDPKANITVNTGAYIVDGYTQTVKWNITVCNKTDALHPTVTGADYVWIDIQNLVGNTGNITIDRFYETGTSPQNAIHYLDGVDENSYIQLGALNANVCKSFTLLGSYTGCDPETLDSLNLVTGWNCKGYPAPTAEGLDTAACQVAEDVLALRYKLSNLDMVVLEAPTMSVDICDTLHYVVELASTANGFMYDVNFWAELPAGASLINGEYNYLVTSTIWRTLPTPVNSFIGAKSNGWHLSTIFSPSPEIWSAYGGGFIGTQKPDSAKIQVRFDIALNCNYNPNDSIVLYSSGNTNCGDSISLFSIQRLRINGFEDLDSLSLTHIVTDTIQCNTSDTIHLTVTNLRNVATGPGDSVIVYIPTGFDFVSSTSPSFIDGSYSSTLAQKLVIPLSPSIPANGTRLIDVIVNTTSTSNCETFIFPMEIIYAGVGHCGQTFCPVEAVIDRDTATIVVCCNPCNVIAEWEADTVCYKTCCDLADTTCFRLIDQSTIGADYIHSWTFGDGGTSTEAQPCHIYDTIGAYYACHTVTQISTGCTDIYCDSVYVIAPPTGAIELLGCNPFCEGDTVYLTVNGDYTGITWVMLPSNTVVGTGDTLTVTTAGRYNAILTNGICTSHCLAIDLQTQIPPEIEIPDTAFCKGDSVYICAGGGFTFYEWALNGTVFNTVDSCVWISIEGVYTVRVGEKLTFGCCTCDAIDTFIVRINDITVTVPDILICDGTSGTLCATVTGGYPAYSYLWQPNGETTPCITVTAEGDYIATVTDAMGCMDSDTGHVSVDFPPNAEFSYDTICLNSEYCFIPVQTPGTHYWEVADSTGAVITTSSNVIFCYTFPYVGTFSVTHILTNACGADTVVHIVEVVPPVEACIVLIGNNPFCAGDTVLLTVNDPFGRVFSVEWYLNDVLIYVGDTLYATQAGTYRARVTDRYGCVSECMCIVLMQNPAPVLNLPPVVSLCNSGSVNIIAPLGFEQYLWYKNGAPYAFGVNTINAVGAGTYVLEVTDANGCKAMDTTLVVPFGSAMQLTSTERLVCPGESFVLTTNYNVNYVYSWSYQGVRNNGTRTAIGKLGGDTNTLYLDYSDLFTAGVMNYNIIYVTVTDTVSGCEWELSINIYVNNCREMIIVPNPVLGESFVVLYDIVGLGYTDAYFELQDMLGNVIVTQVADCSLQEATINVTGIANGSYRLRLIANGAVIDIKQVVIAR